MTSIKNIWISGALVHRYMGNVGCPKTLSLKVLRVSQNRNQYLFATDKNINHKVWIGSL